MNVLGVFAKYWAAGDVKTRLAATIGAQTAADFYRACLFTTLARLQDVGDRRVLAISPPERLPDFTSFAPQTWHIVPQASGDLGHRMHCFFHEGFASGATRMVLIGSDSPTIPRSYLQLAFTYLQRYPLVLGPANDGGYYLVGAAGRVPSIFDDIAWSTADVWRQTMHRLEQQQLPFAVLPEWYDVDEAEDMQRLYEELSLNVHQDQVWRQLWQEVQQVFGNHPNGGSK
jgi:rSAM/selenodomain-associated transferase 1